MTAPAVPAEPQPPVADGAEGWRALVFDTSTERLSIALIDGPRARLHEAVGGARASAALIPLMQSLLAEGGFGFAELHAVGYGRGPGAFTGLRTACAVAQGLAYGCDLPVLPIDTLMAVAEDARRRQPQGEGAHDVWAAMDARMGEVYAARYRYEPETEGWRALCAPALYALEALGAVWREAPPRRVAGSAVEAFGARLPLGAAETVAGAWPSAAALVPLARQVWSDGAAVVADQALPLYLRDKVAFTTAERDAARAAAAAEATP